jgi:hypothetical protein
MLESMVIILLKYRKVFGCVSLDSTVAYFRDDGSELSTRLHKGQIIFNMPMPPVQHSRDSLKCHSSLIVYIMMLAGPVKEFREVQRMNFPSLKLAYIWSAKLWPGGMRPDLSKDTDTEGSGDVIASASGGELYVPLRFWIHYPKFNTNIYHKAKRSRHTYGIGDGWL